MTADEIADAIAEKGMRLADFHELTDPAERLPFIVGFLKGAISHAVRASLDQGESLARKLNIWTE